MAKIIKFTISNFRGVEKTEISLAERVETPIVTLVGLNESGKTTILEAIAHFVSGDRVVSKIFEGTGASTQTLSLIPIHKKANFTGRVAITAQIKLDEADIAAFSKIAAEEFKLQLNTEVLKNLIEVSKQYVFKDGNYVETSNIWDIKIQVAAKRLRTFKQYIEPTEKDAPDLSTDIWRQLVTRLPSISYFPTFLVDLPARIYLREHDDETPTNRHYRTVLQDVLDSLGDGLNLETHVAKRIEDYKATDNTPFWVTAWWATPSKTQVSSVIQKLSNAISKEIIGSWRRIFQTPTSANSITLDFSIDTQKNNLPFVSFIISDGESQYALHERSLGFRWFFSFLLFTRFKKAKDRPTIFLFDEPAANLHARAQGELLKSFSRIVEGGNSIIYSTHSHYMIEPAWLSGAYIVDNKAIDYESSEDLGRVGSKPTNISAIRFKTFVSSYPERVSYYQPILERLEVQESRFNPAKFMVITEGISDFHGYRTICQRTLERAPFEFYPGQGAGSSGPLVSLCLGGGKKFIILLDDDDAGRKEAKLYKERWLLTDDTVVTVARLNPKFAGMRLEEVIGPDMHDVISKNFGRLGGKATKKEIGVYFAERQFDPVPPAYPQSALDAGDAVVAALTKLFEK